MDGNLKSEDSIKCPPLSDALSVVGHTFLRATLVALHSLLWLGTALSWTRAWVWTAIAYSMKHKGTKLECITADAKDLAKVPLHVAAVIQEEEVSCDDLAHIALWAFASNIRVVSLYDPCGNITKEIASFRNRLHHHHRQLFSPPLPDIQVCTSEEAASSSLTMESHRESLYRVLVLSPEDGQRSVVEAAVGVCRAALERGVEVEQVDTDLVHKRITSSLGLPDPQLALVFGSMCSMVGYPPWQLRLTEIYTIPTHHKVTYQQFLRALQRYSDCQQRCGK